MFVCRHARDADEYVADSARLYAARYFADWQHPWCIVEHVPAMKIGVRLYRSSGDSATRELGGYLGAAKSPDKNDEARTMGDPCRLARWRIVDGIGRTDI